MENHAGQFHTLYSSCGHCRPTDKQGQRAILGPGWSGHNPVLPGREGMGSMSRSQAQGEIMDAGEETDTHAHT